MKPLLHVVELANVPILQQLQWEEALLRADTRNWCILNKGSPPALVMGISGKFSQLIHSTKWEQAPLPLIRRFSGGGTVVVDENTLFVTLICQAAVIPIAPFPAPIMQWVANFYASLFPKNMFQLKDNDYVFGERKWGGNAQSIGRQRWLHHSSLLWDYHPEHMEYLLLPSKTPAYRQGRSHEEFLCRLCDYWSSAVSFQTSLKEQLATSFQLVDSQIEELEKVAGLPHRKATELLLEKTPLKGTGKCSINTF